MKYRIKKETKPTLPTFGKYKAVAVHEKTIESDQIVRELVARDKVFPKGVIKGILMGLSDVISEHLREGDRVRLQDFGLLKLEIESEKLDQPQDFRAKRHIRGVRLHFIPESEKGSPALYKDIQFQKEKS